jgi:hypothetical protein
MVELCVFNGVDGTTGGYLLPPAPPGSLPIRGSAETEDRAHEAELRWRHRQSTESTFAPIEGINPTLLGEAGWGLVLPTDSDAAILEALDPLVQHRRSQAGAIDERRCKVLTVFPGESKSAFLSRHGAGPGAADPDVVPYYLLLVGDPVSISFRFQYQLDVAYAVGRIAFEQPREFAAYAESIVRSETAPSKQQSSVAFFAPRNPNDAATALSFNHLVSPLSAAVPNIAPNREVEILVGESATVNGLQGVLGQPPALLFTASHGLGMPAGHAQQRALQGALVCQEWPGPDGRRFDPAWCFSGDNVDPSVDLTGLIAFHFACFGAGTPQWDDYFRTTGAASSEPAPKQIAPAPFVASLPNRLLANPAGGALAAVGHIDRAWGYSFAWPNVGRQTAVYESTFRRLFSGHPLGSALEYFNQRYAELASDLLAELEELAGGMDADDIGLAAMWTARNDARGFTIVGDPAVRLAPISREAVPS